MPNQTTKNLPEAITWKTVSQQPAQRSLGWYAGFGLVGLLLIIFGIYNQSAIMVMTFVILGLVVLLLANQPAKNTTYKAGKIGLSLGSALYPYKVIKKFWIIYNPPRVKTLNFETTAYLNNQITFPLGNQDPMELKLFLSQYLLEDLNREESVTEVLARTLKI